MYHYMMKTCPAVQKLCMALSKRPSTAYHEPVTRYMGARGQRIRRTLQRSPSHLGTSYRGDADVEVRHTLEWFSCLCSRSRLSTGAYPIKVHTRERPISTLVDVHGVRFGIPTPLVTWDFCLAVVPSAHGWTAVDDLHDHGVPSPTHWGAAVSA